VGGLVGAVIYVCGSGTGAITGVNPVTSIGIGVADPSAAIRQLFALLRRCFASAALRSVA